MYYIVTPACKKDVEETKKKYNEVTERLTEKNRQHQKLQVCASINVQ